MTDAAREAFERGVRGLDEGRFGDAVIAFEESLRVRDVPVTLYNLGLAYRGVGREAQAIAMFERYLETPAPDAAQSAEAAQQDRVRRETPLGRWGTPEDVGRVARFLVSPDAAFLTGQIVRVNGGAVR